VPPLSLYAHARIHSLHCTRDRRCSAHPAFPVPSRFRGRTLSGLGRIAPRDHVLYVVVLLRKTVAGELGFEPRQTESESVVLPLHHSPKFHNKINALTACCAVARDGCGNPLGCGAVLLAPSRAWQARAACRRSVARCLSPRVDPALRFRERRRPRPWFRSGDVACIAVTPTCPSARQTPPASPLG
jgi:hypothetical protein